MISKARENIKLAKCIVCTVGLLLDLLLGLIFVITLLIGSFSCNFRSFYTRADTDDFNFCIMC